MHRTDGLVLNLIRCEVRSAIRALTAIDAAWLVLGGGVLFAYVIADAADALERHAETMRAASLWTLDLPIAGLGAGAFGGCGVGRVTAARAEAPFLRAMPLARTARRRSALVAALSCGAPLMAAVWLAASLTCAAIGVAQPFGLGVALAFGGGFGLGSTVAVWTRVLDAPRAARVRRPGKHAISIVSIDRFGLPWIGTWAWSGRNESQPRVRPLVVIALALTGVSIVAVASLVHHRAGPATIGGLGAGLAVFMTSLKCHPLGSPVLRTAPLGFTRAWLRLMRLPTLLSALFFALPAGAAYAAEPSAWAMPVAGGLGLIVFNLVYAVFAAYFWATPLVAVLGFVAALAYAEYESFEYGRTVLLALAALVAFMWHRARGRYRHG